MQGANPASLLTLRKDEMKPINFKVIMVENNKESDFLSNLEMRLNDGWEIKGCIWGQINLDEESGSRDYSNQYKALLIKRYK